MDDFLPEVLQPIHYFLEGLNTPGWLWFFRILLISCLILSLILYHRFKRNMPVEDEKSKKKKGI